MVDLEIEPELQWQVDDSLRGLDDDWEAINALYEPWNKLCSSVAAG